MARRSLGRLEAAGLARADGRRWALPPSATPPEVGDPLAAASGALLSALGNRPGRLVPVPRVLLRRMAGELTRGSLAATVACAIRCCWLRRDREAADDGQGVWRADFAGRVCGTRAAAAMGLCERTFRDGRLRLEAAGLVGRCEKSSAWANARWGRRLIVAPPAAVEAAGRVDAADCAPFTGRSPAGCAPFAGPDLTNTPAKREIKHQDGAPPRPTRAAGRSTAGAGVRSGEGATAGRHQPRRRSADIVRADLTDPDRLRRLYDRLLDAGEVPPGPAARVRFAGASARAAEHGDNPGGLLRWLLAELRAGRRLDWITQEQEDRGLRLLAAGDAEEIADEDEDECGADDEAPAIEAKRVATRAFVSTDQSPARAVPAEVRPAPRPPAADSARVQAAMGAFAVPDFPSPEPLPTGPYRRPVKRRDDAELLEWAKGWAIIRATEPAAVLRERCGWDEGRIALALAATASSAGVGMTA